MTAHDPMTASWWPVDDGGPYYLIDAPEDGGIEERAWVPANAIEAPEYDEERARGGLLAAAIAFIERAGQTMSDLLAEPEWQRLELTGERVWMRPLGKPRGGEWVVAYDDEPCDDCEDGGDGYQKPGDLLPRPPCRRCHGTRKLHVTQEFCPWSTCEQGDTGAVAFYVIEVVDA